MYWSEINFVKYIIWRSWDESIGSWFHDYNVLCIQWIIVKYFHVISSSNIIIMKSIFFYFMLVYYRIYIGIYHYCSFSCKLPRRLLRSDIMIQHVDLIGIWVSPFCRTQWIVSAVWRRLLCGRRSVFLRNRLWWVNLILQDWSIK